MLAYIWITEVNFQNLSKNRSNEFVIVLNMTLNSERNIFYKLDTDPHELDESRLVVLSQYVYKILRY